MNKQGDEQQGFVEALFVYAFIVILLCKHEPWLWWGGKGKDVEEEEEKKKHRLKLQSDSDIPSAPTMMHAPET